MQRFGWGEEARPSYYGWSPRRFAPWVFATWKNLSEGFKSYSHAGWGDGPVMESLAFWFALGGLWKMAICFGSKPFCPDKFVGSLAAFSLHGGYKIIHVLADLVALMVRSKFEDLEKEWRIDAKEVARIKELILNNLSDNDKGTTRVPSRSRSRGA